MINGMINNGIPQKQQLKFELGLPLPATVLTKATAAYAMIAYQTAYLKAHYPLEFMAALMNNEQKH